MGEASLPGLPPFFFIWFLACVQLRVYNSKSVQLPYGFYTRHLDDVAMLSRKREAILGASVHY